MTKAVRLAAMCAALVLLTSPAWAQQRAFEDVVAQLKSPDVRQRLDALQLLGESAYPEAGVPVAQLLRDPEERVQREALYAELAIFLGQPFEPKKRISLVRQSRDTSTAQRMFESGWSGVPVEPVPMDVLTGLLTPMRSPNVAVRIEAMYSLGLLAQIDGRPPSSFSTIVDALAERLGDPEPLGRVAAARAAGRVFQRCLAPCSGVGADRLGDALVHSLNDPEALVQRAAMDSLGQIRYERAVQSLTALYEYYKQGEMALVALDALSRIAHNSSLTLFRVALARKELDARRAAIEAIGRTNDDKGFAAIDALPQGKRSPNEALAIVFARQRAGRAQQLEALVAATSEEMTREQAQDYLVELGSSAAAAVAAGLPAASPAGRIALLDVLTVIGQKDQVAVVQPYTKDRDARVALAADRAVRRMQGR